MFDIVSKKSINTKKINSKVVKMAEARSKLVVDFGSTVWSREKNVKNFAAQMKELQVQNIIGEDYVKQGPN